MLIIVALVNDVYPALEFHQNPVTYGQYGYSQNGAQGGVIINFNPVLSNNVEKIAANANNGHDGNNSNGTEYHRPYPPRHNHQQNHENDPNDQKHMEHHATPLHHENNNLSHNVHDHNPVQHSTNSHESHYMEHYWIADFEQELDMLLQMVENEDLQKLVDEFI